MLKFIADETCIFDIEWVPDPTTIRRVYNLCQDTSDQEAIKKAYKEAGATKENPAPFLKTVLCKIVSIAGVYRKIKSDGQIVHRVFSSGVMGEERLNIEYFMNAVCKNKPQLVGYNILNADIPILIQRALANNIVAPKFCERPSKPWEGRDYFGKYSDWAVDLMQAFGGFGSAVPSLYQLACACGIPGKMEASGDMVAQMYAECRYQEIISYNECDAITTYLLWLRAVKLSGLVTMEAVEAEENQFIRYLKEEVKEKGKTHFENYLHSWKVIKEMK